MKISEHGRLRMIERTGLNHKERRNMFREALDKGKNIQDIKDEEIREYVKARQHKCMIKLWKDYLFIYSKNGKQLYTMYKLPEDLSGKERYKGGKMTLDKAIKHKKEKRKQYRGAKAVDHTCRNHGSCPYCQGNRTYKNKKREMKFVDIGE